MYHNCFLHIAVSFNPLLINLLHNNYVVIYCYLRTATITIYGRPME